jgi:hypothetical protein
MSSSQLRNSYDPYQTLDELAGCLGEEPFEFYDFDPEVGGFYEAR